jgi:mono/diheme cytochrome c family protein
MQPFTIAAARSRDACLRMGMALALLCGSAMAAAAQQPAADSSQVRLGRYLVTHVAMCADCHTPRGPGGRLDMSHWLQGAPIGSRPLHPRPWAVRAPGIAGLPTGWTTAQVVHLLRTGERPDGSHPLPPMPPYRMDGRDARAVAAYLASLAH